jgi:DNA-directed RNA polymerase specialized sigma24 family protein
VTPHDYFRRVERDLFLYPFYREALATTLQPSIPSALGDTNTRVQHSVTDGTTAALGSKRAEYGMKVDAIERGEQLLMPEERMFFQLRYLQGLPFKVIQREMHIGEMTSYRLRHRVLSRFAIMLGIVWEAEQEAAAGLVEKW